VRAHLIVISRVRFQYAAEVYFAANDQHTKVLLIDEGPIADFSLKRFKRAEEFRPREHSFNPLPMDYRRAREFASIVYGDQGQTTLTARNGKRALTRF
jgi:hypothetical protein